MNFWKDFSFPSPVDDILKKGNFTLEDLLDEDDVVQDARSHKDALITYLCRPEVVTKMLDYVTKVADDDVEDKVRFRYPSISAEILASDVTEITVLMHNDKPLYIDRIFGFFSQEQVHPFNAQQVLRVIISMIQGSTTQTLAYMRSRETFLPTLLKHIQLPPVADFFTKIANFDNPESSKLAMQYLVDRHFVSIAVDKFGKQTEAMHDDVGSLLSDLILSSGGSKSPITQSLMETEHMEKLFTLALEDGNQSAFATSMPVITQLLDALSQSQMTFAEGPYPPIIQQLVLNMPRLKAILITDTCNEVLLPQGKVKPFGIARVRLMELLDSLSGLIVPDVDKCMMEQDLFRIFAEHVFAFENNNILHRYVQNIFNKVATRLDDDFVKAVLDTSQIVSKTIAAEKANAEGEANGQHRRPHLAFVLDLMVRLEDLSASRDGVKAHLDTIPEWDNFTQTVLKTKQLTEATVLGGSKPTRGDGDFGSMSGSSSNSFLDMSGAFDDDDESSNSDDDSDNSEEEEESDEDPDQDEDDDLDTPDNADMPSESDGRDYDTSRAEVLLSKRDIELLLEVT